jgi:transcriptional regulator with XRE-family HTH domain
METTGKKRADVASRALGIAVVKRRNEMSLSQEALAERAELHRTYISDIERGARNVSFRTLYRLAYALDLECAALVKLAEASMQEAVASPATARRPSITASPMRSPELLSVLLSQRQG